MKSKVTGLEKEVEELRYFKDRAKDYEGTNQVLK